MPRQPIQQTYFCQNFSDKEDLVRSSLDDQAQAFLSDQRQQLADVTTIAGLDTWRDNLVVASRQRGGAFGCVLATMVSQLAERDEHNRVQVAGYFAEWRRLVATTPADADRRTARRDAAPDELATGLIAACRAATSWPKRVATSTTWRPHRDGPCPHPILRRPPVNTHRAALLRAQGPSAAHRHDRWGRPLLPCHQPTPVRGRTTRRMPPAHRAHTPADRMTAALRTPTAHRLDPSLYQRRGAR
jgi:hypothetical protein